MVIAIRVLAILVVAGFAPVAGAQTSTVQLVNGDELHGQIVERNAAGVVLEHPQLGRLELAGEDIESVFESDSDGSTPPASDASETDEAADDSADQAPGQSDRERPGGFLGTRILRGWTHRLGAGFSGSIQGRSDTRLNALFQTQSEDEMWEFDSAYFVDLGRDGGVSKNQGFAQLTREWTLPNAPSGSRWLTFGQGRWDRDQFQPWGHRLSAAAGTGYRFLATETSKLTGRIGINADKTFGSEDRIQPEALVGLNLTWRPHPLHKIVAKNDFFQSLTHTSRRRTVQSFQWDIDISGGRGLGLRLGALYRFDTEAADQHDFTYLGSLTYEF